MKNFKELGMKLCTFIKNNSSTILTVLGCTGVVATAVTSAKAGMKAARKIDVLHEENPKATKKDEAKEVVSIYIPTAIVTAGTVGCIIGLYNIDKKKQAALISACMVLQAKYNEFRKAVDARGIDHTKDIDEFIREAKLPERKSTDILNEFDKDVFRTEIHSGEPRLCWDSISQDYFIGSLEDIMDERYQINRYFRMTDAMSANDYFTFMGLPEKEWGDGVGWDSYVGEEVYGYRWIDIYTEEEELADGLTVLKVMVPFEPTADYLIR